VRLTLPHRSSVNLTTTATSTAADDLGFDLAFLAIFFSYLGLRGHGLWSGNPALSDLAFDILACGAAILFPRLAFTVLKGVRPAAPPAPHWLTSD
jgi:hypothetical protein